MSDSNDKKQRSTNLVSEAFAWPVRVYYEDTDTGGVVFYANYLKFFERAHTEWLRALGYSQHALAASSGLIFVVRSTTMDYFVPARLDDELKLTVVVGTVPQCVAGFRARSLAPGGNRTNVTGARPYYHRLCQSASFCPQAIPEEMLERIKRNL